MVPFGASFLTVLLAVAHLGNAASVAGLGSDSSENLSLAGVAAVDNTQKTKTVTETKTTETNNKALVAGALDKSSKNSQHVLLDSAKDDSDVVINLNIYDNDDDHHLGYDSHLYSLSDVDHTDYSHQWSKDFLELGSKDEKVLKDNHELFNHVYEIVQSNYGALSGRYGLLKDFIRAVYIVLGKLGANVLGNNGLFEKTLRDAHRIIVKFISEILGNPGLLSGIIRNVRFILFEFITSVLGGSGLFNYGIDLTNKVQSDLSKSVFGPYKYWPSVDFNEYYKGSHKDVSILPIHPVTDDTVSILPVHPYTDDTVHILPIEVEDHHPEVVEVSHDDYPVKRNRDILLNLDQNRNRFAVKNEENSASASYSVSNKKESAEGDSASSSLNLRKLGSDKYQ